MAADIANRISLRAVAFFKLLSASIFDKAVNIIDTSPKAAVIATTLTIIFPILPLVILLVTINSADMTRPIITIASSAPRKASLSIILKASMIPPMPAIAVESAMIVPETLVPPILLTAIMDANTTPITPITSSVLRRSF